MKKLAIMGILFLIMTGGVYAALSDSKVISISLVNQDPDPAVAGDIVEVRLGVENRGGAAAENLVIEVVPEYPFTMVPGESEIQKIGTLKAYQTESDMKIIKFKIRVDRDSTAGEYKLKIKEYEDGSPTSVTRTLSIDIENKESAEVIYIDQVELIPGKITPLKFTINNVGATPLRDLTFHWENEDDIILPVGSDNTKYMKYIDIADSSELTFNVIASANADPDLYKLDLTLTYDDPITGEEKETSTKAGVYVGGATDFDAAFSGSSSGEYSFAISNIGSVSASSVTVKVPDQSGWSVSGSNSVIIGNLNEGDYTIASFKLQKSMQRPNIDTSSTNRETATQSRTVATGTQTTRTENTPITLEIVYTDSRGNRNTIEKEVHIDSSATPTAGARETGTGFAGRRQTQSVGSQMWTSGKWVLLGFIILSLSIVVRKKYKKEKIENKDYSYLHALKDIAKIPKNLFKSKKKKNEATEII